MKLNKYLTITIVSIAVLIQLTIITVLLFSAHSYLAHYLLVKISLFFPLWQIYLFHFLVTALLYTFVNYKHSKGNSQIFNTFMAGTLFKMVLAIVFLLPLLLAKTDNKEPDVFNFFIPYFLFLAFEVYSLTKLLNKK